ncbi:neuroendocrine convertase 1-like isoform 4-T5 [Spinachia spinachia]
MFSAALLVLGCLLLQRNPVTTEGHRETNRHVFYALQVDGGPGAAKVLAKQHGLEFILRVHQVTRQHDHCRDKRVPVERLDLKFTPSFQRRESASDRQPEENKSDQPLTFNDPLWPMQWELFAQGEYSFGGLDLNVMPVWINTVTGDGVVVSIIDDGIRLLDGPVTDAMEATSLTYNMAFIDIYVCSWGPRDNGATMDGPHSLTAQALRLGTNKGRRGKGSIFVWAAGNGGLRRDHCGADGYVNSIYNIAIGGVSETGKPAFFGEPCPGVMAVTLTGSVKGGPLPLVGVTVTNMDDGCVTHFPGTSSAAPIAAGILALTLEVNPGLTWRDVQHLIANTAKIPDPKEPGWSINAAGYHVHHSYGFGLLDAGLMVQQAAHFNTVIPQRECMQEGALVPARILSPGGLVTVNIQSDACLGTTDDINTLEHVQVNVSINAVCRGDLSISLESPAGTVSLLLDTRPNDASKAGLKNWALMTVHCWGEQPRGLWTLQVTDHKGTVMSCSRPSDEQASGAVLSATLILYGTYRPHRAAHDGPLQSVVSMGLRHPVHHMEMHQPLELIQWVYQMERDRKVQAAEISIPARHKMWKVPRDLGLDNPTLNQLLTSSSAFQEGLHQSKQSAGLILLNDSRRRSRKKTASLEEPQLDPKRYEERDGNVAFMFVH